MALRIAVGTLADVFVGAEGSEMIVQLPEWKNWRIEGCGNEWQVQNLVHGKDGDDWRATNYFPSLAYAVKHAYEKALRASKKRAATVDEMLAECNRVKDELAAAVEEAAKCEQR